MASWWERGRRGVETTRRATTPVDPASLFRSRRAERGERGFLGGFTLGAAAGVALAWVFAPRRREQTREQVAERAGRLWDRTAGLAGQQRAGGGAEPPSGTAADGAAVPEVAPAIEREIDDGDGETDDPAIVPVEPTTRV